MARIIGVAGGSGSGKTTIVRKIRELVNDVVTIPQDSYYLSAERVSNISITGFNFDHPSAFDPDLLIVPEGGENEKALEVLGSFMRGILH